MTPKRMLAHISSSLGSSAHNEQYSVTCWAYVLYEADIELDVDLLQRAERYAGDQQRTRQVVEGQK